MWINDKKNNCSIYAFHLSYYDETGFFPHCVFNCPEGRYSIDDRHGLAQHFDAGAPVVLDPSIKLCRSDSGLRKQILRIHDRIVSGETILVAPVPMELPRIFQRGKAWGFFTGPAARRGSPPGCGGRSG